MTHWCQHWWTLCGHVCSDMTCDPTTTLTEPSRGLVGAHWRRRRRQDQRKKGRTLGHLLDDDTRQPLNYYYYSSACKSAFSFRRLSVAPPRLFTGANLSVKLLLLLLLLLLSRAHCELITGEREGGQAKLRGRER